MALPWQCHMFLFRKQWSPFSSAMLFCDYFIAFFLFLSRLFHFDLSSFCLRDLWAGSVIHACGWPNIKANLYGMVIITITYRNQIVQHRKTIAILLLLLWECGKWIVQTKEETAHSLIDAARIYTHTQRTRTQSSTIHSVKKKCADMIMK